MRAQASTAMVPAYATSALHIAEDASMHTLCQYRTSRRTSDCIHYAIRYASTAHASMHTLCQYWTTLATQYRTTLWQYRAPVPRSVLFLGSLLPPPSQLLPGTSMRYVSTHTIAMVVPRTSLW
eukprot:655610-Rhodomonas_salina.4